MTNNFKKILGAVALLSATSIQPLQAEFKPAIVGGETAGINEFPSTVALLSARALSETDSAYDSLICGGTLIRSNWVLTAAHCLFDSYGNTARPSDIAVLTGSKDLINPLFEPTSVKRLIVHGEYDNTWLFNDIALIELSKAADAPAIALNNVPAQTNDTTYIAGWGDLEFSDEDTLAERPTKLQKARLLALSGEDCVALGGPFSFIEPGKQICAGWQSRQISGCFGDSGGPLFTVTERNTLRLAGITSGTVTCGTNDNEPVVYTDVIGYASWIDQNLNSERTVDEPKVFIDETEDEADTVEDDIPGNESLAQTRQRLTGSGSSSFILLSIMLVLLHLRRRTNQSNC